MPHGSTLKIAILFHERARGLPLSYLIDHYAEYWREDGHEVLPLYGVRESVPADVLIVHVDLSVVPDEYLEFARRYPLVVNGEVKDIRKSTFSRLLLQPGEPYGGKVIVKSNFNYAGVPERTLGVPLDPNGVSASFFGSPQDYQIFENPSAVPTTLFNDPNVVVEKFQPETESGVYFLRTMLFLGERVTCGRMASRNPIVNASSQMRMEFVEPHPEMMKLRKEMKFNYGKFDYVIHNGQPLLLDANKTPAAVNFLASPQQIARRRFRAEGLYEYFEGASRP